MIPLNLSQYEQDALAELSIVAASVKWQIFGTKQNVSQKTLDEFVDVVMRFDRINWGTMYDKLHRSGANS